MMQQIKRNLAETISLYRKRAKRNRVSNRQHGKVTAGCTKNVVHPAFYYTGKYPVTSERDMA